MGPFADHHVTQSCSTAPHFRVDELFVDVTFAGFLRLNKTVLVVLWVRLLVLYNTELVNKLTSFYLNVMNHRQMHLYFLQAFLNVVTDVCHATVDTQREET